MKQTMETAQTKSVFAAVTGKPNVGKSSLVNVLVGEKTAIVTPKAQTTRTRVTGILTREQTQYVFIDTPGFHKPRTKLGERMARAVTGSLGDADVAVMVFEPLVPISEAERELMAGIKASGLAAVGVVNKIDTVRDEAALQARAAELSAFKVFETVLKTSAVTGEGCDALLAAVGRHAVAGPHFYPDDAYTDTPLRQMAAEIIREKLLLFLSDEIPHGTAVEIERFAARDGADITDIDAVIYCEKKSHKGMVIGKGGQMLKKIACAARLDLEELLGGRVNLKCWVKIKDDWRDNEYLLNALGFQK